MDTQRPAGHGRRGEREAHVGRLAAAHLAALAAGDAAAVARCEDAILRAERALALILAAGGARAAGAAWRACRPRA
ncbi:MAG TPA: hypothetical protein VF310_02975 [Vicinamibacteria bacterium]